MKLPVGTLPVLPSPGKSGLATIDFSASQDGKFDALLASGSDQAFQLDNLTEVTIDEMIDAVLTDEHVYAEYVVLQTESESSFNAVQFSQPSMSLIQNPIEIVTMNSNPDVTMGMKSDVASVSIKANANVLAQPITAGISGPSEFSSPILKSDLSVGQIAAHFAAVTPAPKNIVTKSVDLNQSRAANGNSGDELPISQQSPVSKDALKTAYQLPGLDRLASSTANLSGLDQRQSMVPKPAPVASDLQGTGIKIENISMVKPAPLQSGTVSQQVPIFATVVPHNVAPFIARVSAPQLSQPIAAFVDDGPAIPSAKQATSIELQLVPRTLGVVDVKISSNIPGQLSIEIKTQTAEAETLMRSEMNNLKEALRAIGMSLDELRVSVQQQPTSEQSQGRSSNGDAFQLHQNGSGDHAADPAGNRDARDNGASEDDQAGSKTELGDKPAESRVRTGLYL